MIYMHKSVHLQRESEIAAAAKPVPPKTVTFIGQAGTSKGS